MGKKKISDVLIKFKGDNKELDKSLTDSQKKLKKFTDSAIKRIKQMGAAFAATAVIVTAYSIKQAMTFEGLERAFEGLVSKHGVSSDKFMAQMKAMSYGTVSEMEIMKKANMGLMLGLKPDALITFMETATTISQATGMSAEYMFESLVTGTARQSKQWLDNLGIMISIGEANKRYAAALGLNADKLTEEEQKLAFSNMALEESKKKLVDLGGYVIDTKNRWDRLIVSFKDASVALGQQLMPEFDKILTWIITNKDWMINTFAEIFDLEVEGMGDMVVTELDKIKAWVDTNKGTLADMWAGVKTGIDMTITSLKVLLASMMTVSAASRYVMAVGEEDEKARWGELQAVSASTAGMYQDIGQKDWAQDIVGAMKAPEGRPTGAQGAMAFGPLGPIGRAAGITGGRAIQQKIEIVLDSSAVEKFLTGQVVGVTNFATVSGT